MRWFMSDIIEETYKKGGEEYSRTKTVLKKDKTERGFGVIAFTDRYHQQCSLQDSSIATEAAIWLGVDNTGPQLNGPSGKQNEKVQARMHLTQAMVKQLLPYLKEFARTGNYIAEMDFQEKPPSKVKKVSL